MTWFLKLPDGTRHDLEDLPMSAYVEVEAETGTAWHELGLNPYRHAAAAIALMRKALPGLGCEMPEGLSPKSFVTWFVWEEEDSLPTGGMTAPTEGSPSQPEADAA